MPGDTTDSVNAAKALAEAVSGSDTPEAIRLVQREPRLETWIRLLSGPAVTALTLVLIIVVADRAPFMGKLDIWSETSEEIRAQGVVWALMIMTVCIGLVVWVAHVGKPRKTEITAGPVGVTITQDEEIEG